MANNQQAQQPEDIGKYARHPLRTIGGAFLVGTIFGASMLATKKSRERNSWQKILGL